MDLHSFLHWNGTMVAVGGLKKIHSKECGYNVNKKIKMEF